VGHLYKGRGTAQWQAVVKLYAAGAGLLVVVLVKLMLFDAQGVHVNMHALAVGVS
jgi:hypothetical protein